MLFLAHPVFTMGSVEKELWNIFTCYALHGNARDPEHLKLQQFVIAGDATVLIPPPSVLKTPSVWRISRYTMRVVAKRRRRRLPEDVVAKCVLPCLDATELCLASHKMRISYPDYRDMRCRPMTVVTVMLCKMHPRLPPRVYSVCLG